MKEELKKYLMQEMVNKKYSLIGAFIGLIVAILLITIGLGKTILIVGLISLGFFTGKQKDQSGFVEWKWVKIIIEKLRSLG